MEQIYKNCQSCGMPLKKSPNGGGTNADGTTSKRFCAYCFENGQFKNQDWTVNQMQDFVKGKMKTIGFPGFLAGLFTKNIPKLERWRNK
ncbi:MAG: zinc ribbon domain-containing protein [Ignavibacteria bacterium]|nr:zinc ribbon domain-containing protein [Ignavibacteria bacterium]